MRRGPPFRSGGRPRPEGAELPLPGKRVPTVPPRRRRRWGRGEGRSPDPAAANAACDRFPRGSLLPGPRPSRRKSPRSGGRGGGVPADTHPPHSGSERGLEPAAGGQARTRPPRPPPSAGSSRPGPSSDRGAPQPRGPRPGTGGGGAGVGRGSGSRRRKRRLHQRPEGTLRRGHLAPAAATPGPTALSPPLPALGYRPPPEREAAGSSPGAGRRRTHLRSGGRRADSAAPAPEPLQSNPALNNGPQSRLTISDRRGGARPLARGGPACAPIGQHRCRSQGPASCAPIGSSELYGGGSVEVPAPAHLE